MNILFYTRLENDTGGDQALLYMLYDAIRQNLPKGSKIKLILSVDDASMERAKRIKAKWEKDNKTDIYEDWVWIRENKNSEATICQTLSEKNKTVAGSDFALAQYVKGNPNNPKQPPVGLFIMAGWSHMQLATSANFLSGTYGLKLNCKILLCSTAGVDIVNQRGKGPKAKMVNFAADLISRGYSKEAVFTLQLGLEANAGYLLSKDFNAEMKAIVQSEAAKDQWVAHLQGNQVKHAPEDLIVIYCSKDKPGIKGFEFLQECQEMPNQRVKPLVVLVGTDPKHNETEWKTACKNTNFSCISIPRTKDSNGILGSVILMRGLLDAKRVLVTGAFTILEALYMGIHDCDYLYPDHLVRFQTELTGERDPNRIKQAFERGQKTLSLLSAQVQKWADPSRTHHINLPSPLPCFAEAGPNLDFKGYPPVASETKEEVVEVNPIELSVAKLEVVTGTTVVPAKPEAAPEVTTAKAMEAKAEGSQELGAEVDVLASSQKGTKALGSVHVSLSKYTKPKDNVAALPEKGTWAALLSDFGMMNGNRIKGGRGIKKEVQSSVGVSVSAT